LERLNDEIKKKRPHLKKKKVHQENAPVHISLKTTAKLHELGYELLPHLPYSPDRALSAFFLFADLKKKMLAGKKFSTKKSKTIMNWPMRVHI
jgi:[histone H3]-lysine36 N-dimethyltransferase SETMAR